MWLSERTAVREQAESGCALGTVTSGGLRPMAVTDGEARGARLLGAAVLVPSAGDEVLIMESAEGERFVLGGTSLEIPEDAQRGEIIMGKGGVIRIKPDGSLELSGRIKLSGTTEIEGELIINGSPYAPTIFPGGGGSGA